MQISYWHSLPKVKFTLGAGFPTGAAIYSSAGGKFGLLKAPHASSVRVMLHPGNRPKQGVILQVL